MEIKVEELADGIFLVKLNEMIKAMEGKEDEKE